MDVFLDRDFLNSVESGEKIKVIMNGWFTHRPENWPPSPIIEPLFVSFHISPIIAKKLLNKKTIEYLKMHQPIGCRDTYTKSLLESYGIEAYFSGCLTLTLDYGYSSFKTKNKDKILIVDLEQDVMRYIPNKILKTAEIVSHNYFTPYGNILNKIFKLMPQPIKKVGRKIISPETVHRIVYVANHSKAKKIPIEMRLRKAEEQIQKLASAKLVITSRLHAALPALAFGTSVIFVHKNLNDPRFSGLLNYLNYYTPLQFKKEVNKIDFDNPPENPNQEELKEIKKHLIKTVIEFLKL